MIPFSFAQVFDLPASVLTYSAAGALIGVLVGTWVVKRRVQAAAQRCESTHAVESARAKAQTEKLEKQVAELQRQLAEATRLAGMTEIATGVIHNIGNVINSVNVSAAMVSDRLKNSKVLGVERVAALLKEHREHLVEYLTSDAKGRQIPGYLETLANHVIQEHAKTVQELDQLRKSVDHVKEIVDMQQAYARLSGDLDHLAPVDLVDDALRLNASALVRHDIRLVKSFEPTAKVSVPKHKVLQILVNLIRNAKHALDDAQRSDKTLTLSIGPASENRIRIAVTDNGVGIPPENMPRLFTHGFTTRKSGHGFGLHASAAAAREMGGSLTASSAGVNQGATFELLLPAAKPGVSDVRAVEKETSTAASPR